MFICPQCRVGLTRTQGPQGVVWHCPECDGRTATIGLLRKHIPRTVVNRLWQAAKADAPAGNRPCPACSHPMAEVSAPGRDSEQSIDVCTRCQFVWFDPSEYDDLPKKPVSPPSGNTMSQEAREKLAILQVQADRERMEDENFGPYAPDEWWHWIPGLLGMPVERDVGRVSRTPWATWSLVALTCLISGLAFFDLENAVYSYGLIPAEASRYFGLTSISSFFLHGGMLHLAGNMYFLLVFGDNVEEYLGRLRFVLLLLAATLLGDMIHVLGEPGSTMPCVGASGGISGIIAFYALTFPKARMGILIRVYFWFHWVRMSAGTMLLLWIGFQLFGAWAQLSGFSHVSALAHLGGAGAGLLLWLVLRILETSPLAAPSTEEAAELTR